MSKKGGKMMPKWSKEEDKILAETILYHLRTGRTQKQAIEEVSRKIGRTVHACGFRWKTIREDYEKEIELAKKDQKAGRTQNSETHKEMDFKEVVAYLEALHRKAMESEKNEKLKAYKARIRELEAELEKIREEKRELEATIGTIRIAVEQRSF